MQPTLTGKHIRLEPLERHHAEAIAAASAVDPSLYGLSPVPQGIDGALRYIDKALALRDRGDTWPFAIIRLADETLVGCTRFWNIERWAWPEGHPRHGIQSPDAVEIGYTWHTKSAIRTAVNTESKLLLLTYAFESWKVLRVCLHTDARNARSHQAILRIGAKFEGILRAHRMAADFIPRDSARFSIVAAEWPEVKANLEAKRSASYSG